MSQRGVVNARVWRLGADVDTDALAPGAYMKHGLDVIGRHCLEAVRPDFAAGAFSDAGRIRATIPLGIEAKDFHAWRIPAAFRLVSVGAMRPRCSDSRLNKKRLMWLGQA